MANDPSPNPKSRIRNAFFRFGFLDAPKESERRQYIRHACSFPVQLRIGSGAHEKVIQATARDVSMGGMLIEGADVPDGVIRLQLSFKIPRDVLPDENIIRTVQTSAAIRYRDQQNKTLSLAFSESLQAPATHRFSSIYGVLLILLVLSTLLIILAAQYRPLTKYILVWASGFSVTLLLTPLVSWMAKRLGMVDVPDERRVHRTATPRGGGLAVVAGFFVAAVVALIYPWEHRSGSLDATWLYRYLVGSGVIVLVGVLDDLRGLRPMVKLTGQVLAAGLMFSMGQSMGRLLGFDLPWALDFLATVFWFVALTNAFNLIDGLDGLATGLALVAGIGLMGAFFIRRMPSDALVMLGLIGACIAFLRYNFHPATIFLGDTGSMFLGFTFASIAIATGSKGTFLASLGVPLLAVGIPVFDTILAIWRRSMRALVPAVTSPQKKSSGLMQPDTEHLHHRLRRRGLNQYQIAVLLYVLNGLLVLTGLLSLAFRNQALGIFLVAFVAGAYVVMRHLAEVELWDTGRAIIRGLRRPQQNVAAFFFYPIFDIACLILSLGLAIAVVQQIQPLPEVWELWITAIPVWVAPVFLTFCATRIYSRVWSLARTNDYLLLSVSLLASMTVSLGLSILLHPELWQRYVVLTFVYAGLAHVLVVSSRMFLRGLLEGLTLWTESQYYRRGGIVRRTLLYGSGGSYLLYLRERAMHPYDTSRWRMIVGLIDDDTNLRFRRVGGYVVLGSGQELPELIQKYRIEEIIITGQLRQEALKAVLETCTQQGVHLSEWHHEERVIHPTYVDVRNPAGQPVPEAPPPVGY